MAAPLPQRITLTLYTFSQRNPPTHLPHDPALIIDCSLDRLPPPELCRQYTGLDREFQDNFVSQPGVQRKFQQHLALINSMLERWIRRKQGNKIAVGIMSEEGLHRSVAMAMALADSFVGREGVIVPEPIHYSL